MVNAQARFMHQQGVAQNIHLGAYISKYFVTVSEYADICVICLCHYICEILESI